MLLWFGLFVGLPAAFAHQSSVAFLNALAERHSLLVTLRIADTDLVEVAALGLAPKELPRPQTVSNRAQALADHLLLRIRVDNLGQACPGGLLRHAMVPRDGGFFAELTLRFVCARALEQTRLHYDLFFDLDPRHQGLAAVDFFGSRSEVLFRADRRSVVLSRPRGLLDCALDYLRLGVLHIAEGTDHLAFLLGLLLPLGGLWRYRSPRFACRQALFWVSSFTLAHCLTLCLAAARLISLPARFVETAIALSIGYVAIENLRGKPARFTFAIGLIHGLGFASVLGELGLPQRGFLLALFSFNAGIEAGQLFLVAPWLPTLVLLSRYPRIEKALVKNASLLLLGLSAWWTVRRLVDF